MYEESLRASVRSGLWSGGLVHPFKNTQFSVWHYPIWIWRDSQHFLHRFKATHWRDSHFALVV